MYILNIALLMLQAGGVLVAPLLLLNVVRGILVREGMYDRESRQMMFIGNGAGILLAAAWFYWSCSFWVRMFGAH